MILLYNIGITFYNWVILIAAHFNEKAKLWTDGRKNIFIKIENDIKTAQNNGHVQHNSLFKKTVWIHVASLGEFEQGRPLIEYLKNNAQGYTIILTFFSPSGYEIRKNYPLADFIFYLPIDTAANAQRFIELLKPDLAIFVKYEFWYHYLTELKFRNIPTLLISGIFNEKQFRWTNPYSFLLKKMLSRFTHLFVQNTPSVFWLKKHHFDNVTMVGDTRIDRVLSIAKEAQIFDDIEKFVAASPTLICGSTWQADEEIILQLFKNKDFNNFKFVIAPHDIALTNIERLQKLLPIKSLKYSEIVRTSSDTEGGNYSNSKILIIDNIGMLSSIYRYGKIAYIGGGFGKGIHNTLEPIAFGLPVIFGPNHKKFEEAVRLVESGGGFAIQHFTDFENVMKFLNIDNNYKNASKAAFDYVNTNKGATQKIFQFIENQKFAEN